MRSGVANYLTAGAIAAFVVVFCVIRFTSSSLTPTEKAKQSILKILKEDFQIWTDLTKGLKKDPSPRDRSISLEAFCRRATLIDLSDSPADFRVAYRHYLISINELASALNEVPDGFVEDFLVSIVHNAFIQGELDGGVKRQSNAINDRRGKFIESRKAMEKIAAGFGAAL
ncbi:MAG: hypothetical protein WCL32_16880 [Planctomycetota bacterium]